MQAGDFVASAAAVRKPAFASTMDVLRTSKNRRWQQSVHLVPVSRKRLVGAPQITP